MKNRVLIDIDCLAVLPKSGKRRDEVIEFCSTLADAMYCESDFQYKDAENGRVLEVSLRCGFIITWWLDAPVKRIVIIDIEKE